MTRLEALTALAEKVETGAEIAWGFGADPSRIALPVQWENALNAYCGSRDAAQALHKAVLPEYAIERLTKWPGHPAKASIYGTHEWRGERWHEQRDGRFEAEAETISRAWLLAIIRALIAMEEQR